MLFAWWMMPQGTSKFYLHKTRIEFGNQCEVPTPNWHHSMRIGQMLSIAMQLDEPYMYTPDGLVMIPLYSPGSWVPIANDPNCAISATRDEATNKNHVYILSKSLYTHKMPLNNRMVQIMTRYMTKQNIFLGMEFMKLNLTHKNISIGARSVVATLSTILNLCFNDAILS